MLVHVDLEHELLRRWAVLPTKVQLSTPIFLRAVQRMIEVRFIPAFHWEDKVLLIPPKEKSSFLLDQP